MEQSDSTVVMELTESAYTMDMWPHAFKLQYSVTLEDDRLATDFCVTNTDSKPLSFTGALHTYWSCDDIDKVAIKAPAFAGATYLDKMQSPPADVKSASDTISIGAPVDSVYAGVSGDVVLEGAHASPLTIKNSVGWSDTVVWSPWGSPPSTARRSPPSPRACWCGSGPRSAERRGRGRGRRWESRLVPAPQIHTFVQKYVRRVCVCLYTHITRTADRSKARRGQHNKHCLLSVSDVCECVCLCACVCVCVARQRHLALRRKWLRAESPQRKTRSLRHNRPMCLSGRRASCCRLRPSLPAWCPLLSPWASSS